jgi:hypothetical protein
MSRTVGSRLIVRGHSKPLPRRSSPPVIETAARNAPPRLGVVLAKEECPMAPNPDGDRSSRDVLLFVCGLCAGGFLTAILFAMAVGGGLVHMT